MRTHRCRKRGFTFIETVLVLAILGIVAIIGIPSLLSFMARSKSLGAANQVATVLRLARAYAVKNGRPVIVKALQDTSTEGKAGEVFAFVDADGDGVYDPPTATQSRFDSDGNKIPGSFRLPVGLAFQGPGGDTAGFSGFTTETAGSKKAGVVNFLPSGAVARLGAIRIRDERNNILEIRIDQTASSRVSIRKFDADPDGADDLTKYYVQGGRPGSKSWNWL